MLSMLNGFSKSALGHLVQDLTRDPALESVGRSYSETSCREGSTRVQWPGEMAVQYGKIMWSIFRVSSALQVPGDKTWLVVKLAVPGGLRPHGRIGWGEWWRLGANSNKLAGVNKY